MNEPDENLFVEELRRLKPAPPPQDFLDRLADVTSMASERSNSRVPTSIFAIRWSALLPWFAPTAGAAIVILFLVQRLTSGPDQSSTGPPLISSTKPVLKADAIEIDRQLVASFDTVARMPGGEPVRFRFREWTDALILRDSARGVVIEQRIPRFEIVPVSFEVY